MCGIVGYIGKRDAAPILMEGLHRLEYRGYDSAGIAHTRWATHGEPSDRNAHPHCDGANHIAVVHNGIIENAAALKARLVADGVAFQSDTDTEVLAHLIAAMPEGSLDEAVRAALRLVTG